jgi:2-iminobutanoate/2-iminopropanoate deaminase
MKKIATEHAPGAIGPYSQGIAVNGLLFVSGQLPIDMQSGDIPHSIQEQTRASLNNAKAIIEAAGASLAQVIKTTVFIKDMGDFAEMNEVYDTFFADPFPARSCVEVARLPRDAGIEIECIVAL